MIHPTAVIAPEASIGERVTVGPYAVIDGGVELGDDCRVGPHVHLTGCTRIGPGTLIHAGAVIGDEPQDLNYDGAVAYTEIGARCVIREYVTVHRGADPESKTTVGDGAMLMAFSHLGHNCHIGANVVIANATLVAGHVDVGDRAFISGAVMIHQFVRIGKLAMVGGGSHIGKDVPPYCMLQFEVIQGPNVVGLRRASIGPQVRQAIRRAIKTYFHSGLNGAEALQKIREEHSGTPEVDEIVTFIEGTKRGVTPGHLTRSRAGLVGAGA